MTKSNSNNNSNNNPSNHHPNGKKKFLFVSIEALIGDVAWQIKKEGHEVRYYIKENDEKDVCDGFVEKVNEWESLVDWADVIVFDDIGFGKSADKLRKEGKLVIGGSAYTDRLEDDREFGQEELKSVGVNVLPHWDFTNFDEAIDFVRNTPGRYVLKPSGKAQNEKELLFIGQEEDGKDVLQVLEHYKKNWAKKIKVFQLQKYASGVEIAVGAFFNGKDFIRPINVNFEHKRMFPGDIGPMAGELGCYDEETEVLTGNGWKFFRDVTYDDEFLTLGKNNEIEYHMPSRIVRFDHHKKLISIRNRGLDLKVTPDHNMYGIEGHKFRRGFKEFEFIAAKDLPQQFVSPRTGIWVGEEIKTFLLPAVEILHYEGSQVMAHSTRPVEINADHWIAFMGIFLSDGCTSGSYAVSIAQKIPEKTALIEELLSKLPFSFSRSDDTFYCYSKQLHDYLKKFGKAHDKFVPDFIKTLSPRQIRIFLDWYCLGDGHIYGKNKRIFYTNSKKMADDIQELLLKINNVGIIKKRNPRGKIWIVDHFALSKTPQYEIIERVQKKVAWIDRRDMSVEEYEGSVYCVTVPNHVLYVRRNGKPVFCGNTLMYWSQPNIIFNGTLAKMKEKLAESGYIGYIDINCIVNGKGIYPLEFTSRFGYPTISIQMEGILTPMNEFLYNMAAATAGFELKTKMGFQVGVVVAVPPYPFNDPSAFKRYSEDAIILFKKQNNMEGIHPGDVKFVDEDWRLAGISGYTLVVTGSGSTVERARSHTYKRVANIMLPNMFFRTDIGLKWNSDSDRLQTWGYIY